MITKKNKNALRKVRHARVRKKISGTPDCPRLCVYRSTSNIYVQVIDDVAQTTLVSASTLEADLRTATKDMTKVDAAKLIGETIGKRANEKGIEKVVFDRGGYIYQGRVAALADGARSAGLKF